MNAFVTSWPSGEGVSNRIEFVQYKPEMVACVYVAVALFVIAILLLLVVLAVCFEERKERKTYGKSKR